MDGKAFEKETAVDIKICSVGPAALTAFLSFLSASDSHMSLQIWDIKANVSGAEEQRRHRCFSGVITAVSAASALPSIAAALSEADGTGIPQGLTHSTAGLRPHTLASVLTGQPSGPARVTFPLSTPRLGPTDLG